MKLQRIGCPQCGADIKMDLQGLKAVFCPFCGSQFAIDDGTKTITINNNINYHKRYTNDAKVIEEIRKDKENEREHNLKKVLLLGILLYFGFNMCLVFFMPYFDDYQNQKKLDSGMIQIGYSYEDFEGKNYQSVVNQLEAAGFKNIQTIDMNDAVIFINKPDSIASISINGNSSFSKNEWFYPDANIIISYH